jgi:chemotaxis protein MotB
MTKTSLISACFVAVATLSIVGCGGPSRNEKYLSVEAKEADARIKELEGLLAQCEAKDSHKQIVEGQAAGKSTTDVDQGAVGPGGVVTTRAHGEEIVITVDNAILFKPGKSELSAQAKATLARVATLLNEKYPGDDVRVDGFTDNQAITRSKDEWDDNWDLSGGRSRAVLHYLIERGVSAKRLAFAGYADNHTVAPNTTDAGRAKNRRVEIVVMPGTGSDEKSSKKK